MQRLAQPRPRPRPRPRPNPSPSPSHRTLTVTATTVKGDAQDLRGVQCFRASPLTSAANAMSPSPTRRQPPAVVFQFLAVVFQFLAIANPIPPPSATPSPPAPERRGWHRIARAQRSTRAASARKPTQSQHSHSTVTAPSQHRHSTSHSAAPEQHQHVKPHVTRSARRGAQRWKRVRNA